MHHVNLYSTPCWLIKVNIPRRGYYKNMCTAFTLSSDCKRHWCLIMIETRKQEDWISCSWFECCAIRRATLLPQTFPPLPKQVASLVSIWRILVIPSCLVWYDWPMHNRLRPISLVNWWLLPFFCPFFPSFDHLHYEKEYLQYKKQARKCSEDAQVAGYARFFFWK